MFKKGPDIDKKKLLTKALDVKKDSLTRLKHFKTLTEHLDFSELQILFKSHFSFIYHTFIDTFSTFDCNSKQRRDELECLLSMLEKILVHNPDLIRKRWQFYSITFVMQKLLHPNNTWQVRQEGMGLFVLWYQILCDERNPELQVIFATLVPGIVPKSSLPQAQNSPTGPPTSSSNTSQQSIYQPQQHVTQHQQLNYHINPSVPQLPIKLCNIDPLVPAGPNEQLPISNSDESTFYLDSLLQYMIIQTTKPMWSSIEESRRNQEIGFSFTLNMFKKFYLQHLFPNFSASLDFSSITKSSYHSNISRYMDDQSVSNASCPAPIGSGRREELHIDLKQSSHNIALASPLGQSGRSSLDQERSISLGNYQAVVIRWLTKILRQDMLLGQEDMNIRTGSANSVERGQRDSRSQESQNREASTGLGYHDGNVNLSDINQSSALVHGIENGSREMDIARKVIGTWPENITVVHELFRRAFLNFHQPASMKRVVNVYKEWICNGGPNNVSTGQSPRSTKLGYASFSDLLQVFVLNSSNAFLAQIQNPSMLDEQVEMCKRIMNIYRYMVMKIYMNTQTWEQLLSVMLQITEHLFPFLPPEKKELTIGGRIAPAFFQTFIVSWIRANLYVHIPTQMWYKFHGTMKNLIKWRELVEEWSITMGSLTRVLVKHVYGLTLTDLPLDRPQDRRRRPRTLKSFSTAEMLPGSNAKSSAEVNGGNPSPTSGTSGSSPSSRANAPSPSDIPSQRAHRSGSVRLQSTAVGYKDLSRFLTRSNSDGIINFPESRLYHSSAKASSPLISRLMRKIKSEYVLLESHLDVWSSRRSSSPLAHNDPIDGTSLKDPNLIIEHDQPLDSHDSIKSVGTPGSVGDGQQKSYSGNGNKRANEDKQQDKCVLLGGTIRGWTHENSVIMWRRMLGLFGNINHIEDPENHFVTIKCLEIMLCDFLKTRENLGISLDNHLTPDQPELIPPYTYVMAWLLEATYLPEQYKESTILAYKLLCMMSIRRHDMELSSQYYTAFYETLHRGLASNDPRVHASILRNSTHLLSLELPGSTFLVQNLYERSRSMLVNAQSSGQNNDLLKISVNAGPHRGQVPRDQAIQILGTILALHRPIRKLMMLKTESGATMSLVAPGDTKSKIFETLLSCNSRPVSLDTTTRVKLLCSLSLHIYQELTDGTDSLEIEKLFDNLLTDLQDSANVQITRIICDMLRLFSDHAQFLASSRPMLVSSLIQITCQLIVRLSSNDKNKESVHFLLVCLEDWCMSVEKHFLLRPIKMQLSPDDSDDTISGGLDDSLVTVVLRSLESVLHDRQHTDESRQRVARGSSASSSKTSDTHSGGHSSKDRGSNSESNLSAGRDGRTFTNEQISNTPKANLSNSQSKKESSIKLACKVSRLKLITYLGHFPLRQVGPASMSCCVNEIDYFHSGSNEQETSFDMNCSSSVCLFVLNGSTIVSFIGSKPDASSGLYQPVHIIVRNLCGKYSWDATCIELDSFNNNDSMNLVSNQENKNYIVLDADSFQETARGSMKYDSDFNDDCGNLSSSLSSRSSSNRDCIGDLLNFLSLTLAQASGFPCYNQQQMQRKRNTAQSVANSRLKIAQAEETMIALLTNQRFQELNYNERSDDSDKVVLNVSGPASLTSARHSTDKLERRDLNDHRFTKNDERSRQHLSVSLEQCRQLVQQLGYLSWEKRHKIDSLAKNQRLMRELKNLDGQPNRETHKIAVIYVANGQEDKTSILTNSTESRAFEEFISGLGWQVNLANHLGFKGGLQANKSTGDTSTYYCNATTEVMFHVSTRIPIQDPGDDESLNRKLRHLGNDEIHIVWSEHTRDYRRGIIPTEFGDIIIAIYPMLRFQGYFRIQVLTKDNECLFGPLYDNCIVHQTSLAPLVRATAINASRAKRLNLPYYQSYFEERSRLIESIIQNHREKISFEDFAMQLYNTTELKLPSDLAVHSGLSSVGADQTACC